MKKEISPAIIAVAVVVVLGLIGAVGYLTLGKKQSASSSLNSSNPNYEKYMNRAGSSGGMGTSPGSGGTPSQASPNSGGSPGSSGSPNH